MLFKRIFSVRSQGIESQSAVSWIITSQCQSRGRAVAWPWWPCQYTSDYPGLASSPWSGEWQWENMGPNIGSGRPQPPWSDTISALKDGEERERTLGFLSDLIATYIIGAGPGPATLWHWMLATTWILCIRENLTEGEILAQKRICSSSQAAISFISIPLADPCSKSIPDLAKLYFKIVSLNFPIRHMTTNQNTAAIRFPCGNLKYKEKSYYEWRIRAGQPSFIIRWALQLQTFPLISLFSFLERLPRQSRW